MDTPTRPHLSLMDYYILTKDKKVRKAQSQNVWAKFFEDRDNRKVRQTRFTHNDKKLFVSTVFIGIDQSLEDPPLVFETMGFIDGDGVSCDRTPTYESALESHWEACRMLGWKPSNFNPGE